MKTYNAKSLDLTNCVFSPAKVSAPINGHQQHSNNSGQQNQSEPASVTSQQVFDNEEEEAYEVGYK